MTLESDPYPKQATFSVPQALAEITKVMEGFNATVPEKHAALKYHVDKPDSSHITFSRTAWGKEWTVSLEEASPKTTNVELTLVFTKDFLKELDTEFKKETPEAAFLTSTQKEKRFLVYLAKASEESLKINIEHFCQGIGVSAPSAEPELTL